MKECPKCRTAYTDDSLSFCLSDGTRLLDVSAEEPTVVGAARKGPAENAPQKTVSGLWIKVAVGLAVVVIAVVAVLAVAGVILYSGTGGGTPTPSPHPPTPQPTTPSTPDPEKEKLKDELANIKKRLEEQERNTGTPDPDEERGSPITATVNSPKDGFLALRSQPNSELGERIAKIPHGADVEVVRCGGSAVTIGGRSGRWCYVIYAGQRGWVFDAWLEY
ncbi:MAG: SH3 domain-containing protein [Pyrinomonadaceae bacterium]